MDALFNIMMENSESETFDTLVFDALVRDLDFASAQKLWGFHVATFEAGAGAITVNLKAFSVVNSIKANELRGRKFFAVECCS